MITINKTEFRYTQTQEEQIRKLLKLNSLLIAPVFEQVWQQWAPEQALDVVWIIESLKQELE